MNLPPGSTPGPPGKVERSRLRRASQQFALRRVTARPVRTHGPALAQVSPQRAAPQGAAARASSCPRISSHGGCARVALGDQRRARLEDERLDLPGRIDRRAAISVWLRSPSSIGPAPRAGPRATRRDPPPARAGRRGAARPPPGRRSRSRPRRSARRRRGGRRAACGSGCGRSRTATAAPVRQPAVAQRAMGAQERLLERVLAVLAVAEHVAAEREQRA